MERLVPLPGETVENCATQLGTNSKSVGSSMAQLLTAAAQVQLQQCSFLQQRKMVAYDSFHRA